MAGLNQQETEAAVDIVYLNPDEVEIIDDAAPPPHGRPCVKCGSPVEAEDRFCAACGGDQPTRKPPVTAPLHIDEEDQTTDARGEAFEDLRRRFRCDGCGAEVAIDPDQRSYACAFCDSTYVVEFSRDVSLRKSPEFVIGFAVTPDQAAEKFRRWIIQKGWTTPSDLATSATSEKQRGVYLPFWSFSMLAQSNWSGDIGEYWYRTERYRTRENGKWVTKTRRVRETEWWPLAGKHHRFYSGYMVSGSRGLPQRQADAIKPFHLPAMKRYEPFYLAGWVCEEYSVSPEEALQRSQQEFYRREKANVGQFLPGDTYRSLDVDTYFSHVNSDLCLLPVYVLSYRYKDQLYRFLVNGQTGKTWGVRPRTYKKVGWALAIAAGVAGVIFGGIALVAALAGG